MVTPLEWVKEKASNTKQALYPDESKTRLKAELETEANDRDFRQLNYYSRKPMVKPRSIKAKPKFSSGKVDFSKRRS